MFLSDGRDIVIGRPLSGVRVLGGGYSPSALLASRVAHWSMDEASGNRVDSIGGNTLTDNNTCGSRAAVVNLGADFIAGNLESLSSASNAALQMGSVSFAISLWFLVDAFSVTANFLINKRDAATANEYQISVSPSGTLSFLIWHAGTTSKEVVWGSALTTATKYHVLAWFDHATKTQAVALNGGAPVATVQTGTIVASGAAPFALGTSAWAGAEARSHDGYIDEVTLFKGYVPTVADIAYLYNGGLGRP